MNPMMLGAIVRWIATIAGANGLFSDDQLHQLAGALMTIGTLLWSLWQKHQAEKRH